MSSCESLRLEISRNVSDSRDESADASRTFVQDARLSEVSAERHERGEMSSTPVSLMSRLVSVARDARGERSLMLSHLFKLMLVSTGRAERAEMS